MLTKLALLDFIKYDICHTPDFSYQSLHLAYKLVMIVTKLTMVMVLKGIIIAATKGDKLPDTAYVNPTAL